MRSGLDTGNDNVAEESQCLSTTITTDDFKTHGTPFKPVCMAGLEYVAMCTVMVCLAVAVIVIIGIFCGLEPGRPADEDEIKYDSGRKKFVGKLLEKDVHHY